MLRQSKACLWFVSIINEISDVTYKKINGISNVMLLTQDSAFAKYGHLVRRVVVLDK